MAEDQEPSDAQSVQRMHTISVLLPHSEPKQIQIQAMSSETINDIKQSIVDLPSTNQFSCFHLEYRNKSLNDFVELNSIEDLQEQPEFTLVEDPYTEKESRIHIARMYDYLGGNAASKPGGETNYSRLQVAEKDATPLTGSINIAQDAYKALTEHDTVVLPTCLKNLSFSAWNPVPAPLRHQGHLLYLVLNTLEGESIHITSSISGFYANNSNANKFNPSQRPATKKFHSLLPLLKSLSPLFKRNYADLEKLRQSTDPILTAPLTNAHTVQSWLAEKPEHTADPLRIQKSYLEQGFDNNDSLRDWNEELQSTRELPVQPLPERILRSRLLQKTLFDFSAAAAKGAELLVKGELTPLNPTEEREAQMYIHNNIFFSHGLDGVGTFRREGGDAAAHKAVGLDVNGVRILSSLDVKRLSTLGTCVVDYAGQRIVAQSIVPGIFRQRPDNESQIIYGGVDGRDVVATDKGCDEIFSKVSAALRLRRHAVFEKENDTRKELELSIETKGLAGADGRSYVLDLYRLTPLDIEFLESDCADPDESPFVSVADSVARNVESTSSKYPHRMTMFRYELVEAYWESKLNEYVQKKMADEDLETAQKRIESEEQTGDKTIANGTKEDATVQSQETEAQDAEKTSLETDDYQEVEANGQVAPNGAAEIAEESKERRVDISGFSLLFNPDTFHARIPENLSDEDAKQKEADESLVRDVSAFLRNTVLPRFLQELEEGKAASPIDSASLSKALHKRGINVRYLGTILRLANKNDASAKLSALISVATRDMIARSVKHVLALYTRGLPFSLLPSVISLFLNCLFSQEQVQPDNTEAESYYPHSLSFKKMSQASIIKDVEAEVFRRFRYNLPSQWQIEYRQPQLLREVCLQFGIQLASRDYFQPLSQVNGSQIEHNSEASESLKKSKRKKETITPITCAHRKNMFAPEDILNILPIIKDSTPRSGLAEEAMEAGRLSIVQGQRELGMELLLESLSLHEQIYGVLHPDAARGYSSLAMIYSSLEDKTSAVELAKKAVIVAERTLGRDSSETILFYLNLALFEHGSGNTKQALSYIQHALQLWHLIFGANHPDTITTMNNVAVMLQSMKLYAESLKWFEQSVGICIAVYGAESINAATLYFQIAQAMALTGDHKNSINRMRDSHNIFKKELGEEDRNTKETHMWLSQLTQNAVQLAKQAKIEATRQGRRIGGTTVPLSVSPAVVQNQNQQTSVNKSDERIGTKGLQSIEELVKYISGDAGGGTGQSGATSAKGSKGGKKTRRPMH